MTHSIIFDHIISYRNPNPNRNFHYNHNHKDIKKITGLLLSNKNRQYKDPPDTNDIPIYNDIRI